MNTAPIHLHPFQRRAVAAVHKALTEHRSTLLVLPTGTGKTICFSSIIADRREHGRAMVIAHREELINQAVSKIGRVTGLECDIEMADQHADQTWKQWLSPVIVSTIQTQTAGRNGDSRMLRFDPKQFGTLICDEAHHGTAASYRSVFDHYQSNEALKLIGVTATPNRADEEALGQVFDNCAYVYSLRDAVNDGWLCPIYQTIMPIEGLDISAVKTQAGDLHEAQLGRAMSQQRPLLGLANAVWRESKGRKTLIFAASVEHARLLCGIFNTDYESGSARFVSGKTPKDERRSVLHAYAAGEFRILCNCSIFTEGFDDPGIEVVVPRPTKSTPFYIQQLGRATRTLPGVVDGRTWDDDQRELGIDGEHECSALRRKLIAESAKPHCEVLDLHCQSGRHQLVSAVDALAGNYSDAVLDRARKNVGKDGEDVEERLKRAAEEVRLETQVRLDRQKLEATARYNKRTVDVFASAHDYYDIPVFREYAWDKGALATEKQVAFLERRGIDCSKLTKKQAGLIIGKCQSKPTQKQAAVLLKHKQSLDCTCAEASKVIDLIVDNGWHVGGRDLLAEIRADA